VKTGKTFYVLDEVYGERQRQEAKFGQQNPPVDPIRNGVNHALPNRPRPYYGIEGADEMRARCELASALGIVSYADILLEEVAEAMDECSLDNTTALRKELIQVAAVAVAWVECIDRRHN
jgi:hypothetical protein